VPNKSYVYTKVCIFAVYRIFSKTLCKKPELSGLEIDQVMNFQQKL
jgi:hypothetical protein